MPRRTAAGQRYVAASPMTMGPARLRRQRRRPSPIPGWARALVLVVSLLAIVLSLWFTLDDRFYVYDPTVLGAEVVPLERIVAASRLAGLHVFWVQPEEVVEQILAAEQAIQSAVVDCQLPAECTIAVVERPPMIAWQDGGTLWRIDDSGYAVQTDTPLEDGWYVQGPLPLTDESRLAGPVQVGLHELAQAGIDMASLIYFTPDRGIAFVDQRGWLVILGVGAGMERRLSALETLAAHLLEEGTTPAWVDVHIPDRPYYEPAEGQE